VVAPLVVELLRLGTSVIFDCAGNTPRAREWVRSIEERAPATSPINPKAGGSDIPGAHVIAHGAVAPRRDLSTYAFERTDLQRNLHMIRCPRPAAPSSCAGAIHPLTHHT
jgi:hypothetical protein